MKAMTGRQLFALVSALACSLGTPALAVGQTLDQLACAAGVHCSGALAPDEVRVVLGIDSQYQAERAFIDASRDFPDEVWRCAAAGECGGRMTQNEARVAIPLPDGAFAGAEVLRRREPGAQPAAPGLPASPPSGVAGPSGPSGSSGSRGSAAQVPAGSSGGRRPAGIEVEVHKPGPRELDLQQHGQGGSPSLGPEIQPRDGTWRFAHGNPRTSGTCLQGLGPALARQMPAPQSGDVVFQRPFNASQIVRSPQVTWQRVAPNHWRGTLAATQGQVMEGGWTVRVLNPDRMEGESTVRVSVPTVCHISTPFTFVRQ